MSHKKREKKDQKTFEIPMSLKSVELRKTRFPLVFMNNLCLIMLVRTVYLILLSNASIASYFRKRRDTFVTVVICHSSETFAAILCAIIFLSVSAKKPNNKRRGK